MTPTTPGDGPIVLAGPTGVGKTTVARALAADRNRFVFSVSATTRRPRPGERDGADYEFVSREEFERMVDAGEFAEWARVHDQMYGTPLRNLAGGDGRRVLLDIDPISFAACCRALHAMDLRPDLGRITNPTLVIGGSADATTPPEMSAELAASIAGAELVILDDCGHCPPLQQPEALSAAVDAFLSRHLQR